MTSADAGGTFRLWRMPPSVRLVAPAVALLLAVYLLRPHSLWPELEALRPVTLAAGLAIVALILEVLGGHRLGGAQVSLWFLTALGVWALAGVPWAVDGTLARTYAMALVKIAILYLLLRHALRRRCDFVVVMGTMVACASILAVAGVYQYLFATFQGTRFQVLTGPNAGVNDWALVLAVALPFAVAFSGGERSRWLRSAAVVAGIALLAGIVAAQSKGASLAALAALAPFAWRHRLRGALWLAAAVGLHILVPAAAAVTSPMKARHLPMHYVDGRAQADRSRPPVSHRIELVLDLKQRSYVGRLAIWKVGLELVRQHPLRGVGAGCFLAAYSQAVDPSCPPDLRVRSAHNTFVEAAAELGLPGVVLLAGVLAGPLVARRGGARGSRRGDDLTLAAFSGWFVALLGSCYLGHLENWVLYIAVAAAETAARPPWLVGGLPDGADGGSRDDADATA